MLQHELKRLREERRISQAELAQAIGVHPSAVAMYETGKTKPRYDNLQKIADYFGVSVGVITGDGPKYTKIPSDYVGYNAPNSNANSATRIPVLGRVQAGVPLTAVQEVLGWEEIDSDMTMRGEYFALQLQGDSMAPRMLEGDVVIVRQQDHAETGDVAIVLVDGGEATCKEIKKTAEGIWLIGWNPAFRPIFYSNEEIDNLPIRIVGVVAELRAKFRR